MEWRRFDPHFIGQTVLRRRPRLMHECARANVATLSTENRNAIKSRFESTFCIRFSEYAVVSFFLEHGLQHQLGVSSMNCATVALVEYIAHLPRGVAMGRVQASGVREAAYRTRNQV